MIFLVITISVFHLKRLENHCLPACPQNKLKFLLSIKLNSKKTGLFALSQQMRKQGTVIGTRLHAVQDVPKKVDLHLCDYCGVAVAAHIPILGICIDQAST